MNYAAKKAKVPSPTSAARPSTESTSSSKYPYLLSRRYINDVYLRLFCSRILFNSFFFLRQFFSLILTVGVNCYQLQEAKKNKIQIRIFSLFIDKHLVGGKKNYTVKNIKLLCVLWQLYLRPHTFSTTSNSIQFEIDCFTIICVFFLIFCFGFCIIS